MALLAINWSNALIITGLGLLIVFAVLILLVGILKLFSIIFREKEQKPENPASTRQNVSNREELSEEERAAVALAIYLYQADVHDQESCLLTIRHKPYSSWNMKFPNTGM
ncbi:MAG: OadG family protein [Dysgonamonadaceae bacterium]|jgi:Na+-transporting methylmalonyl-CoA/oxaloacetate decarboxylase gamma subunit|nr:OadG family protein [Dysgonamonadaceae bacterium]